MIEQILRKESARREAFPVCAKQIFMGHAGVTALPRAVADAVVDYTRASSENHQEFGDVLRRIDETRAAAAKLIGASASEIALLGPTSLGLSLFANGLSWKEGDEVVCYADDYPANVYPWLDLQRHGVVLKYVEPERRGEITPEVVARALTPRTRLVALASCHFLTGYRIDVDGIGKLVHEHGALFSLDAIQTLGAWETQVDHVDFLSADSHKWLLGPLTAGIVYVKKEHFETLRPALLGAWNVKSPNFVALNEIRFQPTAQRYEPGVLNAAGIFGMKAALDMIEEIGLANISARIQLLKEYLVALLQRYGFEVLPPESGWHATGITTFSHPDIPAAKIARLFEESGVVASHRHDREGRGYIRLSPHFYNTEKEIDKIIEILASLRKR